MRNSEEKQPRPHKHEISHTHVSLFNSHPDTQTWHKTHTQYFKAKTVTLRLNLDSSDP